jgi:phage baseplate assembly protein W
MERFQQNGKDIVGHGWSYPMRIDGRGGVGLSSNDNDVEESIRIILSTAKGERRMRPNFGCGIHDFIFAPNNAATWSQVAHNVEQALGWWEPRIEVLDVDVRPQMTEMSQLLITIRYRIKGTSSRRSLVYPFYLSH